MRWNWWKVITSDFFLWTDPNTCTKSKNASQMHKVPRQTGCQKHLSLEWWLSLTHDSQFANMASSSTPSSAGSTAQNPKRSLGFIANAKKHKHSFIQLFAMTGILLLSVRSLGQKYRIHDLQEDTSALKEEQESLTNRMNNIKHSLLHEASLEPTGLFASRLRHLFGEESWFRADPTFGWVFSFLCIWYLQVVICLWINNRRNEEFFFFPLIIKAYWLGWFWYGLNWYKIWRFEYFEILVSINHFIFRVWNLFMVLLCV